MATTPAKPMMSPAEKAAREEMAEKKAQEQNEKAYNAAVTYPETKAVTGGVDKGEAGKPWDVLFGGSKKK